MCQIDVIRLINIYFFIECRCSMLKYLKIIYFSVGY